MEAVALRCLTETSIVGFPAADSIAVPTEPTAVTLKAACLMVLTGVLELNPAILDPTPAIVPLCKNCCWKSGQTESCNGNKECEDRSVRGVFCHHSSRNESSNHRLDFCDDANPCFDCSCPTKEISLGLSIASPKRSCQDRAAIFHARKYCSLNRDLPFLSQLSWLDVLLVSLFVRSIFPTIFVIGAPML